MTNEPTREQVCLLLQNLGIAESGRAFLCVLYAVSLSARQPERLLFAAKWLYPEVARCCRVTLRSAELGILTALNEVWVNHREELESLARGPLTAKPSASKFIAILTGTLASNRAA